MSRETKAKKNVHHKVCTVSYTERNSSIWMMKISMSNKKIVAVSKSLVGINIQTNLRCHDIEDIMHKPFKSSV